MGRNERPLASSPDLRRELADGERMSLTRLGTIAEIAGREVGPWLRDPPDGMPPVMVREAALVSACLRRPTLGDPALDRTIALLTKGPLTREALWESAQLLETHDDPGEPGVSILAPAAGRRGRLFVRSSQIIQDMRGYQYCAGYARERFRIAHVPNDEGPFAASFDRLRNEEYWGVAFYIDPAGLEDTDWVSVEGIARLSVMMRQVMSDTLQALRWLDRQPAAEDPEHLTLLDLVARAMPRDVPANLQRRDPMAPSFADANELTISDQERWAEAIGGGDALAAVQTLVAASGVALQGMLPSFEAETARSMGPLDFYDLAAAADPFHGQLHTHRRGAPLTQRLFTEILLAAPAGERAAAGGARYTVTLETLSLWLWPNGWHRGRDLPKLRAAMAAIDGLSVPFESPPPGWTDVVEGPGLWRPIIFEGVLLDDDPRDREIAIRVQLPPSAAYGPPVDRLALRALGSVSAPVYRSMVSLVYFWHRTAGKGSPIRLLRGRLETTGLSAKAEHEARRKALVAECSERNPAADRVSVLSAQERVELAYPQARALSLPRTRNRARIDREIADRALRTLKRRDLVVIETTDEDGRPLRNRYNAPGWRILPGDRWAVGARRGVGGS